jgi:DNA invertase Pin-like site-specific DNA recombinase
METIPNRAKAYSYLRFSTPDQAKGDSFRRQTEAAREYAERNGLDLDQELTFRDLGVSAYRGENAVEGALGQFIEAVDSGRVQRGSYLLVENLDRLSRDRIVPALNRFTSLLEKGINVVTLSDGKVYTEEGVNNLPDLMLSLLIMSRAHDESEMKSRRVRAAWQSKRDRAASEGHILTAMAPAWLRLRDGSFEVIEDRAAIVRRIFSLALEGHGYGSIARRLNDENIEPFGTGPSEARKANGWHPSYILKILSNEAVIGRYQPMRRIWVDGKKRRETAGPPIEGYFPVILDEPDTFYRIRRLPTGASGHKGKALSNILSGLVVCHYCGGRLHFVNKGPAPKGGTYLACDNARRMKTCDAKSVRYDVVLAAVVNSLEDGELDVRALLGGGSQDRGQELMHQIEAIEGRIAETDDDIANLLDVLQRRPSAAVEKRLADHEATLTQLRGDKATLADELHDTAYGSDKVEDVIEAVGELNRVMESGNEGAIGDVNVRLNAALKRIIKRIEIGISDDAREWFDAGISWADKLTEGEALPTELHRRNYVEIVGAAKVSIGVGFRPEGRHLVIYADRRKAGRFVAGAVKTNEDGAIEDFTLKVWATNL